MYYWFGELVCFLNFLSNGDDRLLEVDLQELLEVQVGDLRLVIHAEKLHQRGVGEDAALERRVIAVVGLHVLRDELGHLRLGALVTRLETHKRAELIRKGALDEEGVVRTASLPDLALLGRHRLGVLLHLALGVAVLLLRLLGGLLRRLHGLTNLGGELRGKGLERLRQLGEEGIAGLGHNGGSHHGRGSRRGHNDLSLRGGIGLRLGGLLRCHGGRRDNCCYGGNLGLLGGLLVNGHLVCLRDRSSRGHFNALVILLTYRGYVNHFLFNNGKSQKAL